MKSEITQFHDRVTSVELTVDSGFRCALDSLAESIKRSPNLGHFLINAIEGGAQLFSLNFDDCAANTLERRACLQPTDFFRGFLAATGALDV